MQLNPGGPFSVKVMQVIETKELIGKGTAEDRTRTLYQYWDTNGRLLAEHDSIEDGNDGNTAKCE